MKRSPLLLVCALALLTNACEQHPLSGQAPISTEEHGAEHAAGDANHGADAQPVLPSKKIVDAGKPTGSFFPGAK